MPSNNNDVMLLEELRSLETELHTIEARRNRHRMEMLLHPDFVDSGDQADGILAPIFSRIRAGKHTSNRPLRQF
jgi:hypothetical protein